MHLLVITDRSEGGTSLLPSLDYLEHSLQHAPLAGNPAGDLGIDTASCDVAVVDATTDLRAAARTCRAMSTRAGQVALVVVISEGGLAALKAAWGFDDWLLPAASPAEVETRLRLAAELAGQQTGRTAKVGDLVVDEESYQVRLRGDPLDLTYKEFELLKTLAGSPGRVFTRELLLEEVWGYDYFGGSRTVDVHIRRLRAKLGPEYESLIGTVRGVGYKIVRDHEPPSPDDHSRDNTEPSGDQQARAGEPTPEPGDRPIQT